MKPAAIVAAILLAPVSHAEPAGLPAPLTDADRPRESILPPAPPHRVPTPIVRQTWEIDPPALTARGHITELTVALPDADVTASLTATREDADGFCLTGSLDDDPASFVTVTAHRGLTLVNITSRAHGSWRVRPLGDTYQLQLADMTGVPLCEQDFAHDVRPPHAPAHLFRPDTNASRGVEACPDALDVIDVLFLYTAAAESIAGGQAAIEAEIQMAVDEANLSFANSMVPATVRAVHVTPTTFVELGSSSTMLARLRTPGDGFLEDATTLREQHLADIVTLITAPVDVCGIANFGVLQGFTPRPDLGFNVCNVNCITAPGYAFTHELGHNLGVMHDWAAEVCTLGSSGYAKAYADEVGMFQTVVGSSGQTVIPYFSNPLVDFMGAPTGVSIGNPNPSDAATALMDAVPIVARFRTTDANGNGVCDADDIADTTSDDINGNGIPDEVEQDFNANGVPDDHDIAMATSLDADLDGVPDEVEQETIFVDGSAALMGDGTTWGSSINDLQHALALADASGDVRNVWIASGTYTPTDQPHRALYFDVPDEVSLFGGFDGTESTLGERDIGANPTVLSGDLAGDDLPGNANRDDNSVHVVWVFGAGAVTLDGLTITGGIAVQPVNCGLDYAGGGVFAIFSDVTLRDCTFIENTGTYGGGFLNGDNGSVRIHRCDFIGNHAVGEPTSSSAAGAYLYNGNAPTNAYVSESRFIGNVSDGGSAGCFVRNGDPVFENCLFSGNVNLSTVGRGAGLRFSFSDDATVTNCTFISNTNGGSAGASGLYVFRTPGTVRNTIAWGNAVNGSTANELAQIGTVEFDLDYEHNVVQGFTGSLFGLASATTSAVDPMLADPLGLDVTAGTPDDDARLTPGSPAIDAGDNGALDPGTTTDADGLPRFVDDPATPDTGVGPPPVVDIGAYELQVSKPMCAGDLTTTGSSDGDPDFGTPDGVTNLTDLLYFVNFWNADLGTPSSNPASVADVTTTGAAMGDPAFGQPDGDVTLSDLLFYINQWEGGRVECP